MTKQVDYSLKHRSEPLFRVTKRNGLEKWKIALFYIGAILVALTIGAILLLCLKVNPFQFYLDTFSIGLIGNAIPLKIIGNFINSFVPLLITSLGLSLAFKMKFWNIGGEGQFIIGALVAASIGIGLGDKLNGFFLVILMCLLGGASAGIYGLITAVFKVRFGTNETLLTLMFNYIALYLLTFFAQNKFGWNILLDPNSDRPMFAQIPDSAKMWSLNLGGLTINTTLIIGIAIVVLMFFYYKKTKQGYEIAVVGDSHNTAKYAGMNVPKIILRTVFLSAFIVGLAGAFKVTSSSFRLSEAITDDVGWTGIVVAWLAQLNPFGILLVSFLLAILQFGITSASASHTNLDANFADLLQGIILFVVLAVHFLINYKIVVNKTKLKAKKMAKLKAQGFEIIDLTLVKNDKKTETVADEATAEETPDASENTEALKNTDVEGGKE